MEEFFKKNPEIDRLLSYENFVKNMEHLEASKGPNPPKKPFRLSNDSKDKANLLTEGGAKNIKKHPKGLYKYNPKDIVINQYMNTNPYFLQTTAIYNFDKGIRYRNIKLLRFADKVLKTLFYNFFWIISRPIYLYTPNKLFIYINYHLPTLTQRLQNRYLWKYNKRPSKNIIDKKNFLVNSVMTDFFNGTGIVNTELLLCNLKFPYQDSNILVQALGINGRRKTFHRIFGLLLNKSLIITNRLKLNNDNNYVVKKINRQKVKGIEIHKYNPFIITGFKIKVSGRLAAERVIPRITTKQKQRGSFKENKWTIVDFASYTTKNRRGAYTIKIWTTHKALFKYNTADKL